VLLASILRARNSRYSALVLLAASDFLAAIGLVYRVSISLFNHVPSNNSRNLSEETWIPSDIYYC